MKNKKIGIIGVGGLGSHVIIALARMNIEHIIYADFDLVDRSNLNRQAFFISHIGRKKVDAIKEIIANINPNIKLITIDEKITKENILTYFSDVDVLIEAVDNPESKAEIVESMLLHTNIPIVASSGIAGLYSANEIKTEKISRNLYIVGDRLHEATDYSKLKASRVLVAAGHQANCAMNLLKGDQL